MARNKWPKRLLGEKMVGTRQAEEEGRVHIPPAPGAWSATHLLRAFRVKVALKNERERDRSGQEMMVAWTLVGAVEQVRIVRLWMCFQGRASRIH